MSEIDAATPKSPPESTWAGKFAIGMMLLLALAATSGSLLFYRSRAQRIQELWGTQRSVLMIRAPRVELMRLVPSNPETDASSDELLDVQGQPYQIVERKLVTGSAGLSHVRRSLVEDNSFDWSQDVPPSEPETWDVAIRFSEAHRTATVAISRKTNIALMVETGARASIAPAAEALLKFFDEALNRPETSDDSNS